MNDKKNKLNSTLQIIANFGVILGLAFVGYEVRQNTQALELEALHNVSENGIDITLDFATNPQILDSFNSLVSINVAEEHRPYYFWMIAVLRTYEEQYFLWKSGVLPEELLRARAKGLRNTFTNPEIRAWWPALKVSVTEEYSAWFEKEILGDA